MRWSLALLLCLLLSTTLVTQAQPPAFDVVIRNGRLMDGSGNPWIAGDLGIRGDRIVAMGRVEGQAARTIDAAGQIVAPGFIDVHSHAADGIRHPALRQAQPLLAQGVTTFVANPDGGGPVDLAAQRTALEEGGVGPNIALLIGHGSVRRAVMGDARRAPTAGELTRMEELVRRGMRDGAFGLSSGLFYTPGSFAATEEVIALARAAAESGGVYTSHIRDEGHYSIGVEAAVREVIRIAEEAHTIGIVSHMKALGRDSWGLSAALIQEVEAARARGVQVFADQYPYEASSTSLRAALLPGGVAVGPRSELMDNGRLEVSAEIQATLARNLRLRGGPDAILISSFKPDRTLEGKTLAQVAAARGTSPERTALELIAQSNPSIVSFNMSEADIEAIMRQPWTMTSSDGALLAVGAGHPHPRNDGAFARKLAVYVRDKHVLGLASAIRSMTSLPATVFHLTDRGVLRPGAYADIVVFDPARIRDTATYTDPQQLAEGVSYVLVNGTLVREGGRFTDALPGRVLRRD